MASSDSWRQQYGPWSVVTGASSGIGRSFALELARRGLHVVVAARRRDQLDTLKTEIEQLGRKARVAIVDLGTGEGAAELGKQTADLDVGLCIANAGFGLKGQLVDIPIEDQVRMIDLNCSGTLRVVHQFAQRLRTRGRGGIIITSSTAAFQGVPSSTAYAATKSFDLLLAEGLRWELAASGIDVLALCPGGTDTEGPRRHGIDPADVPGMMTADEVVMAALRGLGRHGLMVPGKANRASATLGRFVPRSIAARIAGHVMGRVIARSRKNRE